MSPEAILTGLAVLANLKYLSIQFGPPPPRGLRSCSDIHRPVNGRYLSVSESTNQ